jgi:purine-binding chemotaxis protein CheW
MTQPQTAQFTTFYVDGDLFGIEVMKVQEVAGSPVVFNVPLAPSFVSGLVNLRGQIATALGMREIFSRPAAAAEKQMSVVCKHEGSLISLIVDSIGDVVEIKASQFEPTPDTIPGDARKYVKGIYKMNDALLSVLDLDALARELSPSNDSSSAKNQ